MGLYRDKLLPRLVERACGTAELRPWRERVTAGLHGRVVEIGFGSGLNVPHYPDDVEVVLAVEPAELSRRLAAPRVQASPVDVQHVGLDGQSLPIDDHTCDAALSTFTLCTIPDVGAALGEVRRVLKPGGRLHFLEHGLSPDASVATWQRRLDPIQHVVGDGCHLTRDAIALVEAAGFTIDWVDQRYGRGPKPWSWFTAGVAVSP
jgi:SAM-dependent methyltransferase